MPSTDFLSAARQAGTSSLDAYESAVDRTLDLQVKIAGLSQQEWLTKLVEAQTDVARQLTESYTAAARKLLA